MPSTGKKALEGKGVDMAYGRELNYSFVKEKLGKRKIDLIAPFRKKKAVNTPCGVLGVKLKM